MLSSVDNVYTSVCVDIGSTLDRSLPSRSREFLCYAYAPLLPDADTCYVVTLAAHELLENVIKYSSDGQRSVIVGMDRRDDTRCVWVKTVNRANEAQLSKLKAKLDRICASDAPDSLYDQLISESVDQNESGLGLIRIRAEAQMSLSYKIHDETVTICALRALPRQVQ